MKHNPEISREQQYRLDLADQLRKQRAQGPEGKEIAELLLAKAKDTKEYKESKLSYEQSLDKLDSLLHGIQKSMDKEHRERGVMLLDAALFKDSIDMAHTIFLKHKEGKEMFSEKEDELIRKLTTFCFNRYGSAFFIWASGTLFNEYNGTLDLKGNDNGVRLLKEHFDHMSQESKEQLTLFAVRDSLFINSDYHLEKEVLGGYGKYRVEEKYRRPCNSIRYEGTEYLFSAKSEITDIVNRTLKETKNEEYLCDMICLLAKHRFGTHVVPENIRTWVAEPQHLRQILSCERFKKHKVYLGEMLEFLKGMGVKISLNDAIGYKTLNDMPKHESDYSAIRNEHFFTPIRDIQPSLEVMVREEDGDIVISGIIQDDKINPDMIKKAKETYTSDQILAKLPKECLKVAYINVHLDELTDLLDSKGVAYLLKNVELSDDKERFDEKILEKLHIGELLSSKNVPGREKNYYREDCNEQEESQKMAKCIIQKVRLTALPKTINGYIFYDELSNAGMMDDEKMKRFDLRTFTWPHSSYDDYSSHNYRDGYGTTKKSFLSDKVFPIVDRYMYRYIDAVINGDDIGKIRGMVSDIKFVSESQMNLLVERVVKSVKTMDDLGLVEKLFTYKTRTYPIIIYLAYCLYNTYPGELKESYAGRKVAEMSVRREKIGEIKELPKAVFETMIKKDIFTDFSRLPKTIPNPIIPNLDTVMQLFGEREAKERKESEEKTKEEERLHLERIRLMEEKEKMEKDAIQSVLEDAQAGVVIINYTKESQKYVLSLDTETGKLCFLTEDLSYHSDIHHKYCEKGSCLGGGRIKIDEETKSVQLYGYSESYGSVKDKFHEAMKKLLEAKYPGYSISIR